MKVDVQPEPGQPAIRVNDQDISEEEILREMQYHPAGTAVEARNAAAEWLVIRTLLLERAREMGIDSEDASTAAEMIIEREVDIPQPTDDECRRYFNNNQARFRSPDLVEAAHILLAADPEDGDGRESAEQRAHEIIGILTDKPELFGELARRHSECDSRHNDGRLGQVARGDTVPEMETFLFNLDEGQLSPVPVKTRYGVHVVRVDKAVPGRPLPYEVVADRVADYLREASWRRAFRQYVQVLAGKARISGIDFAGADSPLVQ